jgi:hypothetical protein
MKRFEKSWHVVREDSFETPFSVHDTVPGSKLGSVCRILGANPEMKGEILRRAHKEEKENVSFTEFCELFEEFEKEGAELGIPMWQFVDFPEQAENTDKWYQLAEGFASYEIIFIDRDQLNELFQKVSWPDIYIFENPANLLL